MATPDEIREAQRATWTKLSASWDKWDRIIVDQLAPLGDAIIGSLAIAPDQRHLDVACGTGEPGLSIAQRAPAGRVVLTDLVPQMLEVASRRAREAGLRNVETVACSADQLPFDDEAFDSVSVRLGYMFFPDVARATAQFARVLRPGGRICSAVWIAPEENAWTSIIMEAIAAEVPMPTPQPTAPNMFRCAAPGYVSALYRDAGLIDIAEWEVSTELVASSAAEYWQVVTEHVAPAAAALAPLDDAARERIRATAIANVAVYERRGAIRAPGRARCIAGTKPARAAAS